jgi:hypothetical protein
MLPPPTNLTTTAAPATNTPASVARAPFEATPLEIDVDTINHMTSRRTLQKKARPSIGAGRILNEHDRIGPIGESASMFHNVAIAFTKCLEKKFDASPVRPVLVPSPMTNLKLMKRKIEMAREANVSPEKIKLAEEKLKKEGEKLLVGLL